MIIVLCPGIHPPELTQQFLAATQLHKRCQRLWIYPAQRQAPFSPAQVRQFLRQYLGPTTPLIIVAFSAGVVGAMGAAHHWHYQGNTLAAFIALDGWGIPLSAPFPVYRLSHDYFTHWSTSWPGTQQLSFYAEPATAHLDLWRSPHQVVGWQEHRPTWGTCHRQPMTAAQFIQNQVCFTSLRYRKTSAG